MNKVIFVLLFITIIIIIIIIIIVVVVVVHDDTNYWVYLSSDHLFQVYYKVRQVLLQSVPILLQSATGITKCDDCYKVRQYTRCLHHLAESSNTGILVALVIK